LKTLNSDRLTGLDTLRALAIMSVMLFHLQWFMPEVLAPVAQFGWMGVDLFFVLSGYLIGSQLLKPVQQGCCIDVLGFYRKRAYRILPAYLVVLALYAFWPRWREADTMSPMWEFLTFTENLFVDYSKNFAFSHVWSLCVEEHFYLLLPVVVLVLARRTAFWKTVAMLATLVLLGIVVRCYELLHLLRPLAEDDRLGTAYIEHVYYPTWTRLDGLLAGIAVALVRLFRAKWWTVLARWANGLLAVGMALVGVSMVLFVDRFRSVTGASAWGTVVGFPLLSLGLAMVLVAAIEHGSLLGRWRVPGAKLLATLAFSLYLTHKAVAHLMYLWFPTMMDARSWVVAPVLAVSCLVVAMLLYVAVERPFLILRDGRAGVRVDVEARTEPAL
jgi:peptidoglycan/LPS O-acetylase OafA/YrhL